MPTEPAPVAWIALTGWEAHSGQSAATSVIDAVPFYKTATSKRPPATDRPTLSLR